jgi:hypothetical protein
VTTLSRHVALAASLLLASACAGRQYDLVPVPRAGDGAPPVKAQVRHIRWGAQPEGGSLDPGASVAVEVDLYNADRARPAVVGMPSLVAHPALGGPPVRFDIEEPMGPAGTLAPGESRTIWATYTAPEDDCPRGPLKLVLVIPVEGQPSLEVVVADPVPGGSRWIAPRLPLAMYLFSSYASLRPRNDSTGFGANTTAFEPIGVAARVSLGQWVLGISESWANVYQEALAGGPPAFGFTSLAQLTWQPWLFPVAPYAEGGVLVGFQKSPQAYGDDTRTIAVPRVGLGLLLSFGAPRIGGTGPLPFDRPLARQRRYGLRVGATRWFNAGGENGLLGLQISFEMSIHP